MRLTLTAISLALALGGCATVPVAVKPSLPALPTSATSACPLAPAAAGDDARVDAAKAYGAYHCENGKRVAIITFYNGLRAKLR